MYLHIYTRKIELLPGDLETVTDHREDFSLLPPCKITLSRRHTQRTDFSQDLCHRDVLIYCEAHHSPCWLGNSSACSTRSHRVLDFVDPRQKFLFGLLFYLSHSRIVETFLGRCHCYQSNL